MLKSDFRKKGVYSKPVTKALHGNKFLVSEYIFELVYHCKGSRWSEICCTIDIAKKSLSRLLLLLILKSSYSRCTVEKSVLRNFTNFIGKHLYWSLCKIKLQDWESSTLLKIDSNAAVFQWNLRNFLEHLFWRTFLSGYFLYIFM